MNTLQESKEIGLKTEISRQGGLKDYAKEERDHAECSLVDAWRTMHLAGIPIEGMVWAHVSNSLGSVNVKTQSAYVGVLTTIKEYTNKAGIVSLAHFSENNYYVASVKNLGSVPTSYEGNFTVTPDRFSLDLSRLAGLKKLNGKFLLAHLFTPKFVGASAQPIAEAKLVAKKPKTIKTPAVATTPEVDDEDVPIGKLVRQNAVRK